MVNESLNESYLAIKIQHLVWLLDGRLMIDKYPLSEVKKFQFISQAYI